jgi:hypothetical protein
MIIGHSCELEVGEIFTPDVFFNGTNTVPPQPMLVLRESNFTEYYEWHLDAGMKAGKVGVPATPLQVLEWTARFGVFNFYEVSTD